MSDTISPADAAAMPAGYQQVIAAVFDPQRLARLTRDFASPATSGPAAPSAQAAILSLLFDTHERIYTMSLDLTKLQADVQQLQAVVSGVVSTHQQLKTQLSSTSGATETDQQKLDDAVALIDAEIHKLAALQTAGSAGSGSTSSSGS